MKPFSVVLFIGLFIVAAANFAQTPPVAAPASPNAKARPKARDGKLAKAKKARPAATGLVLGDNRATPVDRIKVAKGFRVELLYSVPNVEKGSWVNLALDDKGRILASDQYGGLYRFSPPPAGQPLDARAIEKVPAEIRAVNGMVWAFGALYASVNDYEDAIPSGLYRLTDSDGDDRLDKVELLREMQSGRDHGAHGLVKTPDGQGLYWITGNGIKLTDASRSRVPRVWDEDHLLPRMPDGRGHKRDVLAPGGIVYRVSPAGPDFEIVSVGYRNIFDGAVNRDGDLFTYDADMEYDFNTSWYRPTRVCHVTSGSEFGWRNGAGKRPEWYADNLPPVLNIGPGSPTGMTFGYGAKFPARYQEALFILDWSWGKVYAVHLTPSGATYTAEKEEFLSGAPLPVTDAIIHPADGAMYFAIGGRKVQSGLYRVTYVGGESTAVESTPVESTKVAEHVPNREPNRALRERLEEFHGRVHPQAIEVAWPYLSHSDRFVRWAARTAIEHQPVEQWRERVLAESDAPRQLEALLALARVAGVDPFHRQASDAPVDTALAVRILDALNRLDWNKLSHEQRLALVRTYEIVLNRFGRPEEAVVQRLLARLDPLFPAASRELNWLLCETLVYLQSAQVAGKALDLIDAAATQEEQIEYARSLRMLAAGWTPELRRRQFAWFQKAASFRGGASFDAFLAFIRADALATLDEKEKVALGDLINTPPVRRSPLEGLSAMFAGRTPHAWTLDELTEIAAGGLEHRNYENGRKMFGAAACFTCHRFHNEGGMTGPDLSSAGRRYAVRDLVDQIVNPSKEINEQFVPIVVRTKDEQLVQGVIVNLSGDSITVNTDPTDPNQRLSIDRKEVLSVEPSRISPMPVGLLNPLTKDEILDLVAYILSGGDGSPAASDSEPPRKE
jgi:putative heme-binding domain-containing protein